MKIIEEVQQGPICIESPGFIDSRGAFIKIFNSEAPSLQNFNICQVNYVLNPEANIIRGLHFQQGPWSESKFFRTLKGKIQLQTVDLRPHSENRGKSYAFVLDDPMKAVLVPRGFATGYLVLEPHTEVLYLSDNIYKPEAESGIRWNDEQIAMQWLSNNPTVSEKDQNWNPFQ